MKDPYAQRAVTGFGVMAFACAYFVLFGPGTAPDPQSYIAETTTTPAETEQAPPPFLSAIDPDYSEEVESGVADAEDDPFDLASSSRPQTPQNAPQPQLAQTPAAASSAAPASTPASTAPSEQQQPAPTPPSAISTPEDGGPVCLVSLQVLVLEVCA